MTTNANTMNTGLEAAAVAGDKGTGGNGQGEAGLQRARNESLPSGPGDSLPNVAISAMRSAQVGGISDHGAHSMLHNGLSIGEGYGGGAAKFGEAVAIAGSGALAIAGGIGASAIAEGAGASAVAEGRAAHAVAEGPGAHAVAEGPGARAVAEDAGKAGHRGLPSISDHAVLEGRPIPAAAKSRELPLKGAIQEGYAQKLPLGHASRDN